MMMLMKFITHLSNSDDESKKSVAYKKKRVIPLGLDSFLPWAVKILKCCYKY